MKSFVSPTVGIAILVFLAFGCMREDFLLNDQLQVDGLHPSFAIPLGYTSLNLGNLERAFDSENFIYNEQDAVFAFVYRQEIARLSADQLALISNQDLGFSYELSAGEAAALSALPAGQTFDVTYPADLDLAFENGPEIETITFNDGVLSLDIISTLPQNTVGTLTIPALTLNSFALQVPISLSGNSSTNVDIELDNYVLDLTQGGAGSNFIEVVVDLSITSTGAPANSGDGVSFELTFDFNAFESIYGYLGMPTPYTYLDTQYVDLFKNLLDGTLFFADPHIDLTITNTSGIPFQIYLSGVFAPENQIETELGGIDLTNIPTIIAAPSPGLSGTTLHSITSQGTIPSLSTVLQEGPFELLYETNIQINPNGNAMNWLLDSSYLACVAELFLPFNCYADNFAMADTLDLNFEGILGNDGEGPIDWQDVKRMQLRLVADNGLPIELFGQVYFTDSLFNVIDSLYYDSNSAFLASGYIDFSLDESHPDHGRVLNETRTIRDSELTRDEIRVLIDQQAKKVILKARSNTFGAGAQELVRFYPEYELKMKLSAKIDTEIEL